MSATIISIVRALRPGTKAHQSHLRNRVKAAYGLDAVSVARTIVDLASAVRGDEPTLDLAKAIAGRVIVSPGIESAAICGPFPDETALVMVPEIYSAAERRFAFAWAVARYVEPRRYQADDSFANRVSVEIVSMMHGARATKRWISECNPERSSPLPMPASKRAMAGGKVAL